MKTFVRCLFAICGLLGLGNFALAQAPTISYGTPAPAYVFPLNQPITPITPTTSIGVTGSFNTTTTTFYNGPNGSTFGVITYDAFSGNFYAVTNGNLYKISAAGVAATINTTTLNNATDGTGIITDGLGNIYVSDANNNDLYEFSSAGALIRTITGLNGANGVAVDASNNVYVADANTNDIYKIAAGVSTTKAVFLTGFTTPYGVAITPSGDMYVSQNGGSSATRGLIKIAGAIGGGTTKTTLAAGTNFTNPRDLTLDAFGDLFLADGTTVKMISPTGTVTTALTGLTTPGQVDFDPSGNMYIADENRNIKESAVSYYTISAALPTGLSFSTATGVVTGTPTVAAGPTLYTVTAHNTSGTATAQFTITCKVGAPVITYSSPVTLVVGTPVTLTPTNSGSPITSASPAPALPAGLTISATGVISGTPTTVTAAANYVITANNAGGSGTFTINITVNPKLPAITYTTPNVYTTGVLITPLNPNTSGGGAVASYAISPALPAGLSIDPLTGIISGTPTGTATIATYTVTATNVTGNGTFPIVITVNPPKPVITYGTPQTYVVGTAITTLSAGNTGGPIVSFSVLPALPAGLSLNPSTGDITGTPTVQSVATNYVVTATNAGGNGAFTINITVLPMPPVISYTTPNVFVVGTAYTLNPSSTGGPVVSYSVSPALPAGLNIAPGTGVISGTPTAVTAAADYVVTATNANTTGTFTVNITVNNPPVPIFTYTNPAAITYGGTVSVTPANSGGIPTGCTISPTGTGVVVSAAGVVSGTPNAAGTTTYTITPSNAGGTGPGATVTIIVNQAVLTVTVNNQTKVYGAAIPALTFAYSGFTNGDTQASLTTGATVTTTATTSSPVSPPTYPITASGVVDPNYTFNYVAGALTITKAALNVKANAQTKVYGTAFTFAGTEFTTTGLQPGDAVTSATLTSPGAAATATVAGSTYTITASAAVGTGLSNYTITYTTNTFTVTKATLTVTANNQTKVYGNTFTFAGTEFTLGAGQLKNSDNVTGATITSTGSVNTATVAGSPYPILISAATGTGLANYTIGYVNGSMTVTPAPVTITANSQTRDVGITTTLTVTYSGLQNGAATTTTQPTISTTATAASPVGSYPITASGAADPNYTISYVAGVLTITASGTHTYTWDWTAASNTTWENPLNWNINGVQQLTNYPGSATNKDIADIGVNVFYTSTKSPFIAAATISVASINFGTDHATTIGLVVNGTLTTSSDITLTVDNNIFGNALTVNLSGTGTINVPNLNLVNNETVLAFENSGINSSVANLNVSGNITLTTTALFLANIGSKFTVTGGTTTVGGVLKTVNNTIVFAAATSTFSVNPTTTATLNLTNANAISLDNNTSVLDFDHPGSTVNYNGTAASQTVYTSATVNASTGANYRNLTISGSGTGVPQGGTLTVDQDMLTSGPTNFGTNAPTVNVAGNWTNTANVTQGAAIIAVNTQLIATSNTITGGSGTLTAASMEFNGGTLVAGAGTVTCTGAYQNDGGTFNCGTAANANVIFNGTYTNNNGIFIANPTSTSKVTFTGTNQTLIDKTTAGTTFNNVNFNGNNTAITSSTGNFAVAAVGTLTMGASAKLTAGSGSAGGAGYLTLLSNASSTATVAAIPSTSSVQGAINVQRFITGGAGTRGYRLLTSPINISTNAAGSGNLGLGYLNTNASFGGTTYLGAFTEGPGTGFTYNGSFNPIIYLYDESRPSTNQGFTAGKNIGIYSILPTSVTTLTGATQGSATIPVGNSYLLYYVGDNHLTDQTAVSTSRVPESIDITATGYINQGNVPVKFWNTSSTNIPYDVTTGTSYPGLNQVGNPYPSTISLDVVATDNAAINKVFWELVPGGSYVSYSAAPGHPVSDARASKYILSGQGFLVEAQATGETLTFKEGEKVAYPAGLVSPFNTASSTALLMDIPSKPGLNNSDVVASPDNSTFEAMLPPTPGLAGLHLQLTKDGYNFVQTGIYFTAGDSDKFVQNEDAISISGSGAQVFLSSYSSDNVNVGINQLGDYSGGKRIRMYAGVTSSGAYTISLADIANIDTIDYNVFLVDKKLNDSVDMVQNKSYAFNINNSDTSTYGANRFVLAIEHKGVPQYVLNSFTGNKVAAGVLLTWLTTNASDYTGYILQKQDSNGNYNAIYSAQSDKGEIKYSFIDQNPVIGNNTYRLEQNDVYGKITYSNPLTIFYNKNALAKVGLSVYPNPSNSVVNVIYTNRAGIDLSPNYTVDIFNAAGTFIKHESVSSNAWTEDISAYKLGVYLLQLKDNNGQLVGQTKFIKNL